MRVGILVVAVWAWGRMPFGQLTHNGITQSWHTTSYDQARQAAVDVVPNGATVEASNELAPTSGRSHKGDAARRDAA